MPEVLKAIAIADIHGSVAYMEQLVNYVKLHNVHYILIAGDLAADRDKTTFNRVIKGLGLSINTKIIYVRGESDPQTEYTKNNILNVENRQYVINEITIAGIPPFLDYELKLPVESKIKAYLTRLMRSSKISREKYIILTHIPPYGLIVDKHPLKGNMGSIELRDFIKKIKPYIVICGHVHSGIGVDNIQNTLVLNPGPFRRGYFVELLIYSKEGIVIKFNRFTLPFEI